MKLSIVFGILSTLIQTANASVDCSQIMQKLENARTAVSYLNSVVPEDYQHTADGMQKAADLLSQYVGQTIPVTSYDVDVFSINADEWSKGAETRREQFAQLNQMMADLAGALPECLKK